MTSTTKVKDFFYSIEKSYNKTVIDIKFSSCEDLSTLKSDIHLGLAASVFITFSGR